MDLRTSLATILETAAAALRRGSENARLDRRGRELAVRAGARSSRRSRRLASRPPLGYWRCTHAADQAPFNAFKVGQVYECHPTPEGSSSYRIHPGGTGCWSPYWSERDGRFCYPSTDIDFEYLGPVNPDSIRGRLPQPDRGPSTPVRIQSNSRPPKADPHQESRP